MSLLERELNAQHEVVRAAYRELFGAILTDAPAKEVASLARVLMEKAMHHYRFEDRLHAMKEAVWLEEHHAAHGAYVERLQALLLPMEEGAPAEPSVPALQALFREFEEHTRQAHAAVVLAA